MMQPLTFMKCVIESLSSEGDKGLALLLVYSGGRRDSSACVSPSVVSKGFLWWVCSSREGLGGGISFSQGF